MKFVLALLVLAFAAAPVAASDDIRASLADLYEGNNQLRYLGFESVQNPGLDQYGVHKYMVLDFRAKAALDEAARQASVHQICTSLLRDVQLVRSLTAQGYDMVSVAFDRRSQYDCI